MMEKTAAQERAEGKGGAYVVGGDGEVDLAERTADKNQGEKGKAETPADPKPAKSKK